MPKFPDHIGRRLQRPKAPQLLDMNEISHVLRASHAPVERRCRSLGANCPKNPATGLNRYVPVKLHSAVHLCIESCEDRRLNPPARQWG